MGQDFGKAHAMIHTVGDLINFSLKASGILGIGQTASAEDAYTGLDLLRMLIAQWQKKRWLVFVEQEVSMAASTGAQSYSIGPGQQFDCSRPNNIKAAYIRILGTTPPNMIDIPLEILQAREDYAAITVKTLQTMPYAVWYESGFPTGNLWFWPVPPAAMYGLYVTVQAPLPLYEELTDELNVPPEYYEALMWSLAVRMQMSYGMQARPDHVAAMNQALNTLRQANAQIAHLAIPAPLGRIRPDISLVGPGIGRAFILDEGAVLG